MKPILEHAYQIPGFCQPVSSLSHLITALALCLSAASLVRLGSGNRVRMVALAVYAICVIGLLTISGTYHSLDRGGTARALMKRFDYFAIWLLIAGTFTAVHGVMCRGFWRWGVLTLVWLYAAAGILLQVRWFKFFSGVPGLVLYLGLGWAGLASIIKLGRQIGFRAVRPIWYSGIFFSAGAVLEAMRQPVVIAHWVGPHEIFHFAVIAGVVIHWKFIRQLLVMHAPAMDALGSRAPGTRVDGCCDPAPEPVPPPVSGPRR